MTTKLRSPRPRRFVGTVGTYFALVVYALVSAFPLLWMVATAFKPASEIFKSPPEWFPWPIVLTHFADAVAQAPFANMFLNTVLMSIIVMIGQLTLGSFAAYAFARIPFRGRQPLFYLFLFGMMVPPIVVMVPLFVMLHTAGLINTEAGLTLPQIFSFGTPTVIVFFLRQYFMTLPLELEEAATVDGCNGFRTFWSIVLPNARPALATAASLSLVASWNTLLWPLLVAVTPDKYVLTTGIGSLIGEFDTADWGQVMAAATLVLLPILVVFALIQRHLMRSISTTGLK